MRSSEQSNLSPPIDAPVILFDGVCNLCELSVQFVIANDRAGKFRFASLQSEIARRYLQQHDCDEDSLSSVILIEEGRVYRKSRAALRVAKCLDKAWPMLFYLFYWIPPLIADRVYDFIGARRYRWFGKKESCWIPNADLASRFLDSDGGASALPSPAAAESATGTR